ncbi:hypothetical protein IQ247_23340 [Plectonema cf. radiosum LEGE 06105]|uniref:Uncharacterized protein n=1 Tax=Plectonema cf. radiosum LEGE 06105 TaxID=945769 RepID=A0A8J7JVA2_9CYAN|nr:hypothetical protein [Plectonema radiosum]MBE9215564.1 hypothetical protein [Plectonema cf. radiosum LEGE 06105]
MDEKLQQLVIQIQNSPPQTKERQTAIIAIVDKILRSCILLFRYSQNTSLNGVYLDIYQALQQYLHQDISQNIDEYQLQNLPVAAWVNEVRSRSFQKVINEVYLQQLALEVQKYQQLTPQWQYAFQVLTNAILLSDKLLHKPDIDRDVYEEAKNELWIWLHQNINTYNANKGKFTAWLNFRFDMILRTSHVAKNDPFIQKLNGKIIRNKYQLTNIIKNISQKDLISWLTFQIKQLVPYVLGAKILFLLTVIFFLSQSIIKKPVIINSLLFEIAKQSLPTAAKLANLDDEIENIPQIEVEKSLLEQLREYLETNPNQLLQKHMRGHPEVTFQVIALKRLEGIGWKELSETFNIGIPALSNFFQRHLQKIAPKIRKYIQE